MNCRCIADQIAHAQAEEKPLAKKRPPKTVRRQTPERSQNIGPAERTRESRGADGRVREDRMDVHEIGVCHPVTDSTLEAWRVFEALSADPRQVNEIDAGNWLDAFIAVRHGESEIDFNAVRSKRAAEMNDGFAWPAIARSDARNDVQHFHL